MSGKLRCRLSCFHGLRKVCAVLPSIALAMVRAFQRLGCQDSVLTEFSGGANSHVVVGLILITLKCDSSSMHLSDMFRSHEHSILTICT
jgi:hypothetical protein